MLYPFKRTRTSRSQKLKELNSQVGQAKNQRIRLESDIDLLRTIPETRH